MRRVTVQALDLVGGWLYDAGCWLMHQSVELDKKWITDVWQEVKPGERN